MPAIRKTPLNVVSKQAIQAQLMIYGKNPTLAMAEGSDKIPRDMVSAIATMNC